MATWQATGKRWPPDLTALLGTLPDAELARRIGRTPGGTPSLTDQPRHRRDRAGKASPAGHRVGRQHARRLLEWQGAIPFPYPHPDHRDGLWKLLQISCTLATAARNYNVWGLP